MTNIPYIQIITNFGKIKRARIFTVNQRFVHRRRHTDLNANPQNQFERYRAYLIFKQVCPTTVFSLEQMLARGGPAYR
jgi:hypothetical protein